MPLLQNMLEVGQFEKFIDGFVRIRNEEKNEQSAWEFYLHRIFDMTFDDFLEELKPVPKATKSDLETTIKDNFDQLFVTDGHFINSLQLGNFAFIPRTNGNLSFKKLDTDNESVAGLAIAGESAIE